MDILTTYWPKPEEVSSERVLAIRADLASRIRQVWPLTDTAPNSLFGDTHLSPAAFQIASTEIAWERMQSDLDPENAANGTVWNCDFVEAFLQNFGLYNAADNRSYGILRLIFNSSEEREIDRSTLFRIGDMVYRLVLPHEGPLAALPPGVEGNVGENFKNYSPYTTTTWSMDVLVQGDPGVAASAGTLVEVDRVIEGNTSAIALSNFATGYPPERLQDLARRTRFNFHSRTPNTRTGAGNYINQRFPDINSVGCLVSGDAELGRDVTSIGRVPAGKMDVMVRADELIPDASTQYVNYITIGMESDGPVRKFVGLVNLPETPIEFTSVVYNGTVIDAVFHSVSKNPSDFPGLTAAFGMQEQFIVMFDMPFVEGDPLVSLVTETIGEETISKAPFTFNYLFDPHLKMVQELMTEGDEVPVGLDTYVRYFTPARVNSMEITFNRKSGVKLNLVQARKEILEAFNRHTFDNPATAAAVADCFAYAGAHSVVKMEVQASVKFSPATRVWTGTAFTVPSDEATYTAFMGENEPVPTKEVTSIYEPDFDYVDTEDGTFATSGPRSMTWLLFSSNLTFIENRSV